jgi:cysteine synthase B
MVDAEPHRYFCADQYNDPANPLAHHTATGPEIWQQTWGRVTHFVAGMGTSGTMMGTGRYLIPNPPPLAGEGARQGREAAAPRRVAVASA